jgi:hypothetical protein
MGSVRNLLRLRSGHALIRSVSHTRSTVDDAAYAEPDESNDHPVVPEWRARLVGEVGWYLKDRRLISRARFRSPVVRES